MGREFEAGFALLTRASNGLFRIRALPLRRTEESTIRLSLSAASVLPACWRLLRIGIEARIGAAYTVRFESAVFVLHIFQKKSKRGAATPKADMDLIRERLKVAERIAKEVSR